MMTEKGGWEEMTFGKKKTGKSNGPRQPVAKNSRATRKTKTSSTDDDSGNEVEVGAGASEDIAAEVKPRKGKKRNASDVDSGSQEVPLRRSVRAKKDR